ncbi:Hypothetical protein Minf_2330 [Methylacidiphilum infernorum V4]|uniref:Uncharacterized protein n=1 Tax=Methylacidiphilum infernorum (isolate V4) TaxID=481448 RepID=B3E0F5_METI4|nr:Hypothetical protein Minf_2330 [Methylacidiphilum infernorum V4]
MQASLPYTCNRNKQMVDTRRKNIGMDVKKGKGGKIYSEDGGLVIIPAWGKDCLIKAFIDHNCTLDVY